MAHSGFTGKTHGTSAIEMTRGTETGTRLVLAHKTVRVPVSLPHCPSGDLTLNNFEFPIVLKNIDPDLQVQVIVTRDVETSSVPEPSALLLALLGTLAPLTCKVWK